MLQRKKIILALMALICFSAIPMFLSAVFASKANEITVNSVSCHLDGYDVVFAIEIESNQPMLNVDFTLKAIDEYVSISDTPTLSWKSNQLTIQLLTTSPIALEFRLFVSGSSDLPAIYSLNIQNVDYNEIFEIKPFTHEEAEVNSGGMGAGFPYLDIHSYSILTNPVTKGQQFTTRTVLYNWYWQWLYDICLNFRFDSTGTNKYEGITNAFVYEGVGIDTGQDIRPYNERREIPGVKSVDVSVPIHGYNGTTHFAFNCGSWVSDYVKARATKSGGTHYYDTYSCSKSFSVSQGSKHAVFCVVMLEDTFGQNLEDYDIANIEEFIEKGNKFSIVNHTVLSNGYNYTQGLYQMLDQEFMPLVVFDWNPAMFGDWGDYMDDGSEAAAEALGLSGDSWPWPSSSQNNTPGTPTEAHGFDILYAFQAQELIGLCGAAGTYCYVRWWPTTSENELYSTICAFLHETCHLYNAKDLYPYGIDEVIMGGAENWTNGHFSSVQIHPITFERINLNKVRFDGPS